MNSSCPENQTLPGALPGILDGWCGPIEWALLDAPGGPVWRRGVWDSVSAVRSDVTIRLPLSRRECRCRAAQWLGEQLGLDPGTTVPRWEYSRPDGAWILSTEHDAVMFNRTGFYGGLPCRKLPEIADQDGPVEKTLRTACLSISASEDVR